MTVVFLSVATATAGCSHPSANRPPEAAAPALHSDAVAAAEAWLALLDEGQYGETWRRSSSLFQERIGLSQWVAIATRVRSEVGRPLSRSFSSSDYASLESRTAIILVWKSDFENLSPAVEQVTMILDQGAWRCAGYYVRRR